MVARYVPSGPADQPIQVMVRTTDNRAYAGADWAAAPGAEARTTAATATRVLTRPGSTASVNRAGAAGRKGFVPVRIHRGGGYRRADVHAARRRGEGRHDPVFAVARGGVPGLAETRRRLGASPRVRGSGPARPGGPHAPGRRPAPRPASARRRGLHARPAHPAARHGHPAPRPARRAGRAD